MIIRRVCGIREPGTENEKKIHFGEAWSRIISNYPKMWGDHDKNWSYEYKDGNVTGTDDETIWESEGSIISEENAKEKVNVNEKLKQSTYASQPSHDRLIKDEYYDMIFCCGEGENTDDDYWLSTRGVNLGIWLYWFGLNVLRTADTGGYLSMDLMMEGTSDDAPSLEQNRLRPIVSINLTSSGYGLEKVEKGDETVSFKLIKNNKNET